MHALTQVTFGASTATRSTQDRFEDSEPRPHHPGAARSHPCTSFFALPSPNDHLLNLPRQVNVLHIRALVKADAVVLFDSYGSSDSRLHSVFLYHLEVRSPALR